MEVIRASLDGGYSKLGQPSSDIQIENDPNKMTCTLLGSFKFIDKIYEVRDIFESAGIEVLAPARGKIVREVDGFKVMDIDGNTPPEVIEKQFLTSLFSSHFGYIVNPEGYVGKTTAMELGLAYSVDNVIKYARGVVGMDKLSSSYNGGIYMNDPDTGYFIRLNS